MGWIDVLRDTVKKLMQAGVKEQEIEQAITTAADKATVTKGMRYLPPIDEMDEYNRTHPPVSITISKEGFAEYARQMAAVGKVAKKAGTNTRDAVDAMCYAVEAHRVAQHRQSNNWRKMHHLPMRRKRGERNGRAGSSHRHR